MPFLDFDSTAFELLQKKCKDCNGLLRRVIIPYDVVEDVCLWCMDDRTRALKERIKHLHAEKGYFDLTLPEIRFDRSEDKKS